MRLDNSALTYFWTCPEKFRLAFIQGIQKENTYFEFGRRFHELLEGFYARQSNARTDVTYHPIEDSSLEAECQSMFEAYKAAYPQEPFEVIECERRFELPLGEHTYLGKIDMTVRDKASGRLQIFETKTESRYSKRNMPEAWMARTQGSLYTWAAQQLYGEPVDSILLNVCTRQSPKGQIGPSFRRDLLERTSGQVLEALRSLEWIADQLQSLEYEFGQENLDYPSPGYPKNRNACVNELGFKCDFYQGCVYGWTPETESAFVKIEPFSHLEM